MRYAYVKTNNVVRELERALERRGPLPQGGPDAYVAHFLDVTRGDPVLLISTHFGPPERDEHLAHGRTVAHALYWYSRRLKRFGALAKRPLGTAATRLVGTGKIFFHLFRFRPDHVLCWGLSLPLWAAYAGARACGARFTYCSHGHLSQAQTTWYQRLTGMVDRWIMRHAANVIVHGPYLKQQMLNIGVEPQKIHEFNWSFRHFVEGQRDDAEVADAIREVGDGVRAILFIGRVERSKGIFELLEAVSERLREDAALQLVYAGDGSGLEPLREAVRRQGLQERVRILGRVPHDSLPALIRRCRFVVTPTQGWYPEGRCMAALEGLVMGRPVIAPDFGPFPFVVEHEVNGLLFETDSVDDLRKKVMCLLDDEALHARLTDGAARASGAILRWHWDFGQALRQVIGRPRATRVDHGADTDTPQLVRSSKRIAGGVQEERSGL